MRQPIVRMNGQLMISNCHNVRTFSELGSSERKLKNIASRKKAWMERNVEVKGLQNVLSMVRAYLWSSLLFGKSLGRNGAFMLPMTIWILVFGVVQHKEGGEPKGFRFPVKQSDDLRMAISIRMVVWDCLRREISMATESG
uniref:Uncharacterized protein n=1 Tax=Placozoa sp. H19 TaxID=1265248 RepID=A0A7I6NFH8_9METZ|nr:hypothetical protein [Placozoa sp. H19 HM-2017]